MDRLLSEGRDLRNPRLTAGLAEPRRRHRTGNAPPVRRTRRRLTNISLTRDSKDAPRCAVPIQHRLDVGRRTGDNAVSHSSQFGAPVIPCVLEQPNVLESDNGLVGESLKSLICAGVKGRTSIRRAFSDPISSSWWRRGAAKKVRNV